MSPIISAVGANVPTYLRFMNGNITKVTPEKLPMSPYFSVVWVICPHFSKALTEHWCCNTKPKEADTNALNDATHCEKAGNLLFVPMPQGGASKCDAFKFIFCINKEYFILYCLKSCFAAIKYQIKHYFDFSNCKFTRSFLISAIWRGSSCRQSSDDANTD